MKLLKCLRHQQQIEVINKMEGDGKDKFEHKRRKDEHSRSESLQDDILLQFLLQNLNQNQERVDDDKQKHVSNFLRLET